MTLKPTIAGNVPTIYVTCDNYQHENPDVMPELVIADKQKSMNNTHACFTGPYDWMRMAFVKNCHKRIAQNPYRIASDIYNEVYNDLMTHLGLNTDDLSPEDQLRKDSVIAALKPVNLATPSIYRIKSTYVKKDVNNMEEFDTEAPQNFIGNENCCKFAGYVSEDDRKSRILIFATDYTLRLLHACRVIYMDGTFRMAPKLWKQIFIVNCEIDDKLSLPVLFALLPDKKTETYDTVFRTVKDLLNKLELPNLTAMQAMADFEVALRNAWSSTFPEVPLKNCMFHYDKVRTYTYNDKYNTYISNYISFPGSNSQSARIRLEGLLQPS